MGKPFSKKHLAYVLLFALLAGAILLLTAWRSGAFYLRETILSPDGTVRASVYERPFPWSTTPDGPEEDVPTTSVAFNCDLRGGTSNFPNTTYVGAWWSPDSRKFLLQMDTLSDSAIRMELINFDRNSSTAFSSTIPVAMTRAGLCGAGIPEKGGIGIVDLTFLQWHENSNAIQFRYAFTDVEGEDFNGTFWYGFDGFIGGVTDIVPD